MGGKLGFELGFKGIRSKRIKKVLISPLCLLLLSNGTNGDDLYIRIATAGNTIQTANSTCMNTYMSTTGNTANMEVELLEAP